MSKVAPKGTAANRACPKSPAAGETRTDCGPVGCPKPKSAATNDAKPAGGVTGCDKHRCPKPANVTKETKNRTPRSTGQRGIVIDAAAPAAEPTDDDLRTALDAARQDGRTTRDAVDAVTARFGVARRRVYALATGSTP